MKIRKKPFARPPGIPRSRIHNANDNKSSSTEEKTVSIKRKNPGDGGAVSSK